MATSQGVGNYTLWSVHGYDTATDNGDKYVIEVRNKTNGNDLTVYTYTVFLKVTHKEY